jgi:hypothetical protein
MTWTKLSDDFSDDCWTLSDTAYRLHTEALIWSSRKLLDLRIDKNGVERWTTHPEAASELVAKGYWEDRGDHYWIVHHGVYQRTREQVLRQQEANVANRAKGKARPVRPKDDSSDDSSDDLSDERDGTGYVRNQSLATSRGGPPPPAEAPNLNGEPDRRRVPATRRAEPGGKQAGCPCGRPAPINPETGLCYWCE